MTVTIINGGTQGLGEALARKLVSQGAKGLVLVGRSADRGEALAGELTGLGTDSIFVRADIADPAAPEAIVAACDERFGTVHGLVNIAAQTSRATLFTDTPDHFDKMFNVNVKAPYFLIQAAARLMLRDGVPRLDRQHRLDVGARRPGPARRLLDVEGGAGDHDPQPRLRPDAPRDPRQPGQPWMDGHRVRAHHPDHLRQRARRLVGRRRSGPPLRTPGEAVGGRQHDRLLPVGRVGRADRQPDRRRPERATEPAIRRSPARPTPSGPRRRTTEEPRWASVEAQRRRRAR